MYVVSRCPYGKWNPQSMDLTRPCHSYRHGYHICVRCLEENPFISLTQYMAGIKYHSVGCNLLTWLGDWLHVCIHWCTGLYTLFTSCHQNFTPGVARDFRLLASIDHIQTCLYVSPSRMPCLLCGPLPSYFMYYIHMRHKYNPWPGDDVSRTISRSIGQRSRSRGSFEFSRSGCRYLSRSPNFTF